MDYRLDDHLRRLDEQAIEDGEAEDSAWCYVHQGFVRSSEMCPLPDMMCKDCRAMLDEDEEYTRECHAIRERRERIREMDLTPEDVWGG